MRIIFLASGAFAQPTLRWLAQSDHEVPLVVTQPARKSGRGQRVTRTPVQALAEDLGLDTLEAQDVNEADVVDRLASIQADLGVVIAFGQKLGPSVLGSMTHGCVNLHASLLPKYRGAAPINWAIIRGEERTGCTVFRIVQRMDAGSILTTRGIMIKPEETAGELHDRLAAIGVDAVQATLDLFEDGNCPAGEVQDESAATSARKLSKADSPIRFDESAASVVNHICGLTPWPGASARFESREGCWESVIITRARRAEGSSESTVAPGTIDARRYVAAKDGYVEILELKPSSGRTMTWPEYVNGRHVSEGDRFVVNSE